MNVVVVVNRQSYDVRSFETKTLLNRLNNEYAGELFSVWESVTTNSLLETKKDEAVWGRYANFKSR